MVRNSKALLTTALAGAAFAAMAGGAFSQDLKKASFGTTGSPRPSMVAIIRPCVTVPTRPAAWT